jgi:glycosyltransferase involved in cell wall biosynthesis
MARFVMVCSSLVAGDAVGNDILQMARLLQADGHEVSYAAKTNLIPGLPVWTLGECQQKMGREHILVYHHCVNLPEAVVLFREHRGARVLRYHNVTPPELLRPYSESIAQGCALGREETLALLSFQPEAIWGDSLFNLGELQAAGAPARICAVIPPFHLIDELHATAPDTALAASLADGSKNILTVGRIVPNKGQHRLIKALGVMKAQGRPLPCLHIAGKITPGLEEYAKGLSTRAEELGVSGDVKMHFNVSLGGLRALYENSQLFAIASDHEGFCVPLVEAMSFGLPVVALAAAAVPETLGEAGMLWPTTDARVWAATFARVLRDEALAVELSQRGRRRYAENFSNEKIKEIFREAVQRLLSAQSK